MISRETSSVTRCVAMIVAGLVLADPAAHATVNLQITEMWPGGLDGTEATSDWFEVTNFGDSDATALNGNLYYDDNSDDPTKNDPLVGIDTIAAGESAIYLVSWEDNYLQASDAVADFEAMWGPPAGDLSSVQIGWVVGGSGLGGGGDAVNIFDGNTADATTLDREEYLGTSEATWVSDAHGSFNFPLDAAQPGVLGAYIGNLPAADGKGVGFGIGSPGVVPEPSSLTLLALTLVIFCGGRRYAA